MENQMKLNEERLELLAKLKELLPDFMSAEYAVIDLTYKDGALSRKIKRLMALALALKGGTTNCVLGQTQLALEAGATKEEILETVQVATVMSGTPGMAEALRVIKFLDEQGKL